MGQPPTRTGPSRPGRVRVRQVGKGKSDREPLLPCAVQIGDASFGFVKLLVVIFLALMVAARVTGATPFRDGPVATLEVAAMPCGRENAAQDGAVSVAGSGEIPAAAFM